MPPDEPTDEERLQELPQDNKTPFQPADPNPGMTANTTDPVVASGGSPLPDDHPQTDTNIDSHELYDEGISGAAETEDTSQQSATTDFTAADEPSEPEEEELQT